MYMEKELLPQRLTCPICACPAVRLEARDEIHGIGETEGAHAQCRECTRTWTVRAVAGAGGFIEFRCTPWQRPPLAVPEWIYSFFPTYGDDDD